MKSLIIQFTKGCKSFFKKYKEELKDVVLFGSFIRGKTKPHDIDILIIFKTKINKDIEHELKNLLLKYAKNVSLLSKTEKECIEPSFDAREGVLFEGYSLINSRFLADEFGFISFGLFFYNTKNMTNVKKTRFYYALNGRRSSKGLVAEWGGIKISNNMIAIPLNKIEPAKEFFEALNINYKYLPSLIPKRMGRKELIGRFK